MRKGRSGRVVSLVIGLSALSLIGSTSAMTAGPWSPRAIVEALASDGLAGRDNDSPGSLGAQGLLVAELEQFAQPPISGLAGDAGYRQPFPEGTNILGLIPGGDRADEFVVIGAHYDHLGSSCGSSDPADRICNGATDNAAGVAVALAAARAIASDGVPRRSVLVALWDAEEDDLAGSTYYVTTAPTVPLDRTIAYINFDIQGADLLPAARKVTLAVAAETGGPELTAAVRRAADASSLDTLLLSLGFGQGRSDHRNFVDADVPSVFFTDATSACYHTAQDDVTAVDFAKLDQEVATATALVRELAGADEVPVFSPDAPYVSYPDASSILELATAAQPDFDRLGPAAVSTANQYLTDLRAIVEAGEPAFDEDAVGTLLGGAATFLEALTEGDCDALDP
jgi:Peptidase family M28